MNHPVAVTVNGRNYQASVEPRLLLSDFLRDTLGLTGTHVGCEHGVCGACTVLMNGDSVRSCLMLAVVADGADITTVEGLGAPYDLNALQEQFREHHGLQCGFPGAMGAGGGAGDDDRSAGAQRPDRVRPGRLPTVSITASTLTGSRAPDSKTSWAPISSARARLASSRLVASTFRPPARARMISAVATPPPAPCTSTVSPALSPPWVKSIRYAVSQAVGRQAASSKDSEAGLGIRLRPARPPGRRRCPGGARRAASASGRGSRRRSRRVADDGVHDDLVAVLVDPGGVAAEDHRQRLLAQPDPAQRPQVVVVQRGRLDLDRGPPVGHVGIGTLPDHEAGQRVVGGEGLGVDGEHSTDPSDGRPRPAGRPRPRQRPPLGPTRGSNGEGITRSSARSSPTIAASASAAASFIPSVIAVARASKAPRKMPGNASTLLIWFGKSERPVATTRACRWATSGCTSGSGLASPKITASGAIDATDLLRHGAAGEPDEDVGADHRVGERAGSAGQSAVPSASACLESFSPARGVQDAAAVGDGDVAEPGGEQDPGHGHAGRAGAGDHHAGGLDEPAGQPQGVLQRGEHHDRGAVLVVVEDRDVEALLEPLLDLEAPRRRDVLEVDAAEARRQPDHGLDDLVDVGGVQADRDGVDPAELLEQHGLALHHRHRGPRADVAEAQHGGAVGDHGDGVGHPGVVGREVLARSPRRPGRRPGCRRATAPRGRCRATREAISILPPTCRAKTGSCARGFSRSGMCSDATMNGAPWGCVGRGIRRTRSMRLDADLWWGRGVAKTSGGGDPAPPSSHRLGGGTREPGQSLAPGGGTQEAGAWPHPAEHDREHVRAPPRPTRSRDPRAGCRG